MRTRSVERTLEELAAAAHGDRTEGDQTSAHIAKNCAFATGYGESAAGVCGSNDRCGDRRSSDSVNAPEAVRASGC